MKYFEELASTIGALDLGQLANLRDYVRRCPGTLYIAGNGGSMASAQHWACDLLKGAGRRVVALGSNPAILTAYANDRSYAEALMLEFDRLVSPSHDRLLVPSCSGRSDNVQRLLDRAIERGIGRALITSTLYDQGFSVQPIVRVPSQNYGVIEDCFMAIGHWLTEELRG